MDKTENRNKKWWGSEEQKQAIRDSYRPYQSKWYGYIAGTDVLRPLVSKTISFFLYSPFRIFKMLSLLTRQAVSLAPERDDYQPKNTESVAVFRESRAHYKASDAKIDKLIIGSYHSFNIWLVIAAVLFCIGFHFRQPHILVPVMFFGLSIVAIARAHYSMVKNWVLRHSCAPGLKAIWLSADRFPEKKKA